MLTSSSTKFIKSESSDQKNKWSPVFIMLMQCSVWAMEILILNVTLKINPYKFVFIPSHQYYMQLYCSELHV